MFLAYIFLNKFDDSHWKEVHKNVENIVSDNYHQSFIYVYLHRKSPCVDIKCLDVYEMLELWTIHKC